MACSLSLSAIGDKCWKDNLSRQSSSLDDLCVCVGFVSHKTRPSRRQPSESAQVVNEIKADAPEWLPNEPPTFGQHAMIVSLTVTVYTNSRNRRAQLSCRTQQQQQKKTS